ncbi:hypothetical protein CJ030_MR0G009049 [Morella rubra]|uniref:Uncharacterized protein n=1 Tax=Morella rubra TaxID=262757 RepID=A0A6A1UIE3_9ROSI|nr:hypothetical protein CJ030_MR0G009049 [Morella rubra]
MACVSPGCHATVVSFIQHPRCTKPAYREEALIRDHKLNRCPVIRSDNDEHLQVDGNDRGSWPDGSREIRQFTWREAKWAWLE